MRIILELRSGPHAGRKTWLQSGQTLQVGNTEDADFVIADDAEMSALHFAVKTDRSGCHLTDLQSERGTFVNGAQIETATLSDGDEILAGRTTIRVRIDGVLPSEKVAAPVARPLPAAAAPPTMPDRPRPETSRSAVPREALAPRAVDGALRFKREECGSGLILLSSIKTTDDPAHVARRVAKAASLYLVLDLAKLELTLPAEITEPLYLLDWLPEAARAAVSPVVLQPSDTPEWPKLVSESWGKGGLVCLYSRLKSDEVLKGLRHVARINPTTGAEFVGDTAMQYWQPDVIRLVLMHSPADYLGALLEAIDAILVEGPEGAGWEIFAQAEFAGQLDGLGFTQVTNAPAG